MTKIELLLFNTLAGVIAFLQVVAFIVSLACWKDDLGFVDIMSLSVWLLVNSIWGLVTVMMYIIARRVNRDIRAAFCDNLCASIAVVCYGGMYLMFAVVWQGLGMYLTFSQSFQCRYVGHGCTTIWVFSLMNIVSFWFFLLVALVAVIYFDVRKFRQSSSRYFQ